MKVLARILSLVVLASAATLYMGCGSDDPEATSQEETQLNKLKSTWDLTSAELGETDRTSDFVGVTMTISGNFVEGGSYNYSFPTGTFPNPSPWPKQGGTFKFGSDVTTQITTSDDVAMNYSLSNSDQTLTIKFNIPVDGGFQGGRINEVEGEWTFVFDKQ